MNQAPDKGFNGYFERLELVDVVQLACLEGHDRHLAIKTSNHIGSIYFADGEIVHAQTDDIAGQDAFFEIMCWPAGTFTLTFQRCKTQSIDASWNFLLTEAMRQLDERMHIEAEEAEGAEVLVVDDSRIFTKAFVKLFENDLGGRIAGEATNGKEALKFLANKTPDLVTLDINMPVMAGDQALKHIMIYSPAPVVLVSSFNEQSCAKMMDFMKLGAVDVVAKPKDPESWQLVGRRLGHILANVKDINAKNVRRAKSPKQVVDKIEPKNPASKLLLILGGLGGVLEVQKILPSLPRNDKVGIIVFQDMYPMLVDPLAVYLNKHCPSYTCRPLHKQGELLAGQCLIHDCRGKWKVEAHDKGMAITESAPNDNLEVAALMASAATIFKDKLAVLVLSGANYELQAEFETINQYGGTILLQKPESCLLPTPVEKLMTLQLETRCCTPENVSEFLDILNFFN